MPGIPQLFSLSARAVAIHFDVPLSGPVDSSTPKGEFYHVDHLGSDWEYSTIALGARLAISSLISPTKAMMGRDKLATLPPPGKGNNMGDS